jgi:thioredoxin reductase (NADPH)
MSVSTQSILESRRDQLFPILEPAEIERVRRFGKVRSYRTGEALAKVGEVSPGLVIILAGHAAGGHGLRPSSRPCACRDPRNLSGSVGQARGATTSPVGASHACGL